MGIDGGHERVNMEKPLRGAVLCCTSILPEQRTTIAELAVQMGAEHKLDLTSDVTHLIVGKVDTPKYKYVAREREDVKVLRPEWVEAVRQAWMEAKDYDLKALEMGYRMPIFADLAICLTGFDNLTFRAQVAEQVTLNGGEYRGDLTKTVTHLIAYTATGKKYQYAQQWDIKIVGLKWLKDSLERGMVLDEDDYHPSIPVPQQGLKAWDREAKHKVISTKRPREEEAILEPPRKLRRSASARIGSQAESLWEDILGKHEQGTKDRGSLRESKSMSNIRPVVLEAKSFATEAAESQGRADSGPDQSKSDQRSRGFLCDCVFIVHGFKIQQVVILEKHLRSHDATIVDSEWELTENDSSSNFVIVPYDIPRQNLPSLENIGPSTSIVTNLWLERCLLTKTLTRPGNHPLDTPLQAFPIPGFEKLTINSSAFEGIERLHVSKVVKTLGAKYDEYFRPEVDILVCNTAKPSEERLRHANEWKRPVVTADWLWACVRSGQLQPWKSYAIYVPAQSERQAREAPPSERQADRTKSATATTARNPVQVERPGADFEGQNAASSKHKIIKPTKSARHGIAPTFDGTDYAQPLREISPNSPQKRSISPEKQIAHQLDGPPDSSDHPQTISRQKESDLNKSNDGAQQTEALDSAIEQLLHKQKSTLNRSTSISSKGAEDNKNTKKKRLFGRALSNMSNSSRDGSASGLRERALSRTSSIDSMNTDGLGSVIATDEVGGRISRPASEIGFSGRQQPLSTSGGGGSFSFTGRASLKASLQSNPMSMSNLESPDILAIPQASDQQEEQEVPEEAQVLTQLGYANPHDAILLRESIIDRHLSKNNPNNNSTSASSSGVDRRIKDDVAFLPTTSTIGGVGAGGAGGVGGGRTTRMRDRRREKEREAREMEGEFI